METALPIQGLNCPTGQFDSGLSPNQKKCGCTMMPLTTKGKVIDSETNKPFEAGLVNIYNLDTKQGTTPKADGSFILEAMPHHNIQVSFVGYKTTKLKASQLPSTVNLVADDLLDEVVITATKKDDKDKKSSRYVLWGLAALAVVYIVANKDKKKPNTVA
ncbi:carboxypeptidase-like regulatory domain-containing protein [Tenacibaculum sp. MAR_2009_124]|uniref:carboxypeptidase-like regulatory domain-containing protein n=1 Tax=Tenacibaculum sp. MAR_2009_124 TaxID=1250059 RepID=UPI00115FC92E|nr:carboxypeptidase-like regulatory domain-containing protein [Tenacibaculum sp. MAR_2009_124]